jgi:uncharacterized membrane protein YedE/YeeE
MTELTFSRPGAAAEPGLRAGSFTPYLVGAGIGVLSWVVFVVVAAPIGVTTAASQVAGGVAALAVGQEVVDANSYWARHPFRLDYGTLFLVGIFLGALASSLANRSFRFEAVPAVWRERFGGSVPLRFAVAFLGGAIAMFGARLANGCTSGNGISQGLQLALVGWVFLAAMFASGLATAWLMFRKR